MKNIPTIEFVVGKDTEYELKITTYKWLTQSENNEYIAILANSKDIEFATSNAITFSTTLEKFNQANNFLVKTLCVNLKYEEFEVLNPIIRGEIIDNLNNIINVVDKKKELLSQNGSNSLKATKEVEILNS